MREEAASDEVGCRASRPRAATNHRTRPIPRRPDHVQAALRNKHATTDGPLKTAVPSVAITGVPADRAPLGGVRWAG